MSDTGHGRWEAVAGVELLDEYGGPPTGHEGLATADTATDEQNRADRATETSNESDVSPTTATIPGDWSVAVDAPEAKHLVGGDWELYAGRGRTVDRRDEWWLDLERGGESVLSGHKIRVGADDAPWDAISAVLGRYR